MKRKVLYSALAVFLTSFLFSSCSLFDAPELYITAAITTTGGSGLAQVAVKKESASGTAVTNASVKLNGNSLVHVSNGVYAASVSGVTEGLEITISVDSPDDFVSTTLAAPASGGGVSTKTIPGAIDGSTYTITCY